MNLAEDLFKTFDDFFTKSVISYDKWCSYQLTGSSDGGLQNQIKKKNVVLLSHQFIIHQTSLCGKRRATLDKVVDNLIKLINFFRYTALQQIQFQSDCN